MADLDMAQLVADVSRDEGTKLKPYRDTVGKLTIGTGRNLDDVGIRPDEAALMLRNDICAVLTELDKALPWWRTMSPARQRALANMAFNLGVPRLLQFRNTLSSLQAGKYKQAAASARDSLWARQVGDRATRITALIEFGS